MTPRIDRVCFSQFMIPTQVPKGRFLTFYPSVNCRLQHGLQVNGNCLVHTSVRMECLGGLASLVRRRFGGFRSHFTLRVIPGNPCGDNAVPQRVGLQCRRCLALFAMPGRLFNFFLHVGLAQRTHRVTAIVRCQGRLTLGPPYLILYRVPVGRVSFVAEGRISLPLRFIREGVTSTCVLRRSPCPRDEPICGLASPGGNLSSPTLRRLVRYLWSPVDSLFNSNLGPSLISVCHRTVYFVFVRKCPLRLLGRPSFGCEENTLVNDPSHFDRPYFRLQGGCKESRPRPFRVGLLATRFRLLQL